MTQSQTISVTVTDDDGAEDTATIAFSVVTEGGNVSPVAEITAQPSTTVNQGTYVVLSGLNSRDSDGEIASYLWSTGETTETIVVTVNETQTITLTVTDNEGSEASATITLTVEGSDPEPSSGGSSGGSVGLYICTRS
nr:PKD domain-containing protein [Vibrio cincinnatiensis]